jgi:YVTN family beta-propeller protein
MIFREINNREIMKLKLAFVAQSSAVVVLLAIMPATAAAQQPYKVLDHWKIDGATGWDYLTADPAAHLLYITHGNRVDVVDTKSGKVAGTISGLQGIHGVALDGEGKFGYISDGRADQVVVFDRKTLATLDRIAAGTNPDGIKFEPVTRTVWAFNGRSKDATVIDAATRKVVATVKLPGKPEFPRADGKGHIFDNIEDKNEIVEIDAASKTVIATWPIADCDGPSGLAYDNKHERLFAVCDKKMAVLDAKTGKQLATADIGDGPDGAAFSAKYQLAFSTNGADGTLSVVDAAHGYKTIETLPTQKGARTVAYDEKTDRIYTVTAEFGPKPAPAEDNPRGRPPIVPGSFTVLVIGR